MKADKYLLQPGGSSNDSEQPAQRNARYQKLGLVTLDSLARAGFVGLAFYRYPAVTMPDYLQSDVDGSGVSLELQPARLCRVTDQRPHWPVGLIGPLGAGALSRAEQEEKKVRPVILARSAESIINWRDKTLVVHEKYIKEDDGFGGQHGDQYRCLRLIDGVYVVEVYRTANHGKFELRLSCPAPRQMPVANHWREIPFAFLAR